MNISGLVARISQKIGFVAASWLFLLLLFSENDLASAQAEPTMTISPASGPPGTSVTAKGTGFPPNTALNIGIGRPNSQFAGSYVQMTTDANGAFEVTFRLERTPDGQNLLSPGRFIVAAHTPDYMFKGLAEFSILPGGGAPSGDNSGAMPDNMPSAGFGGVKTASGNLTWLLFFGGLLGSSLVALLFLRRKSA